MAGPFGSDQAGSSVLTQSAYPSLVESGGVGWLVGWLIGSQAGLGRTRLGRLFGHNLSIRVKLSQVGLVGWLVGRLVGWLVGWLA